MFAVIATILVILSTGSARAADDDQSSTSPSTSGQWQGQHFVGKVQLPDLLSAPSSPVPSLVPPKTFRRGQDAGSGHRPEALVGVSSIINATSALGAQGRRVFEDIFGKFGGNDESRRERLQQMNQWLSDRDPSGPTKAPTGTTSRVDPKAPNMQPLVLSPLFAPLDHRNHKTGNKASVPYHMAVEESRIDEDTDLPRTKHGSNRNRYSQPAAPPLEPLPDLPELPDLEPISGNAGGDAQPDDEPSGGGLSGATKTPPCAHHGRFYCSYKEDYPAKVVTEVTRYYKWPLEKLFRDLRQQVMPKLANDNYGGLVCDSVTRVVRPGWARNTNNRWLVVINTDNYQQFVTEVICRNGQQAPCNFIPPCYQATCTQRYNTQKLLVIDPWNPYKGPFVSEFLFPSCCICFVPSYASGEIRPDQSAAPYADRYKKAGGPEKAEL